MQRRADDDHDSSERSRHGFFASRWNGRVPIERLFWRDLLLVGTALNAATTLAALALLAAQAPLWATLIVHFAPVPYNLFLAFAVWRTAEQKPWATAVAYQAAALLWLLAALLL
ncbi:hypothetical protein KEU06_04560 [Pseudaminobacter sp. 19-2017]|uniref:Uncharacterized protein n=1 Tax=Pseudaminobacter soli (ex Zhang et al. 2022) TaxID=2831468 RepID=A0A942I711_9HYPH|nr:hypothetical protein [Pseudaminobacter soli]MBS3647900.1 hypothetical protein [Pseudaminobacter soli]